MFGPADEIRKHARRLSIPLKGRQDYVDLHRAMPIEDPGIIVRPVLTSVSPLLAIDGMRVYSHAWRLVDSVGMHTIALDKPADMSGEEWEEIRWSRVWTSRTQRAGRDQSRITTLEQFRADQAADRGHTSDLGPNIPKVMGLAKILGVTIDASQTTPKVIQEVRSYITQQLDPSQQG